MVSKDKFIAFVDLLGFKSLIAASESGIGLTSEAIAELLGAFGSQSEAEIFSKHGPIVCPDAPCLQRDLDFKITQVSDSVVVSIEVSPAGLINLMDHCMKVLIRFLQKGFMCRGYITRGQIYHANQRFFGSGYQKAYENEEFVSAFKRDANDRGTPFVEIDPVVRDYVRECNDKCVTMMFDRFTKHDGSVSALFPFARFSHSFSIGPLYGMPFEAAKEKRSNDIVRQMLLVMKEKVFRHVDKSNASAVRKADHYVAAIDAQLAICDDTDRLLADLDKPFFAPLSYGSRPKKP